MLCEIFETMTGRPVGQVEPAAAPWTRRITGTGTSTLQFRLDDMRTTDGKPIPATVIDALFKERAHSIGIYDPSAVAYAGPIMATDYDDDTGAMSVETHEARIYARWRMLAGVNNVTAADLHRDGLSAEAAVGFLTERATGWTGWEMPIDYTKAGAGPISIHNYWYDFRYLEDWFQEIEKRGYEIDMHPYRTAAGWWRWAMRVQPRVNTGPIIDLPTHAKYGIVKKFRVRTSAAEQNTGVLVRGKGEGTDTLTAWAGDPTAEGIPVADVIRDAGDIDDVAALQATANAVWAESRYRTEQWSFSLTLNDPQAPVTLAQVLPGCRFRMEVRKNRRVPDGIYTRRVIALAGDIVGKHVTPEVQPW